MMSKHVQHFFVVIELEHRSVNKEGLSQIGYLVASLTQRRRVRSWALGEP